MKQNRQACRIPFNMGSRPAADSQFRTIRFLLAIVIVGLLLSGVTAFPLTWEVGIVVGHLSDSSLARSLGLTDWLTRVYGALRENDQRFPFVAYGTDWLAFAHLVIAAAFIGPWRDPIRNKWVIQWGILCCVGVIPLAIICGRFRGIPWGWTLIDCSFGVIGVIPLLLAYRLTKQMEAKISE